MFFVFRSMCQILLECTYAIPVWTPGHPDMVGVRLGLRLGSPCNSWRDFTCYAARCPKLIH